MLVPVSYFNQTYRELLPDMIDITRKVHSTPDDRRRFTAHIGKLGNITQYSYYVSIIKRHVPDSSADIVDWGGQFGQVSRLLGNYYHQTVCYSPNSDELILYWQKEIGVTNALFSDPPGNYRKINIPDRFADAVVSSGVLEHTRENGVAEAEALSEIKRILKPGGLLFIWNLPYRFGSVEIINTIMKRNVHRYRYDRKKIISLLDESGFVIDKIDHHEIMNMLMRNLLGAVIGHNRAFIADYILSKVPPLNLFRQHFTIIARACY